MKEVAQHQSKSNADISLSEAARSHVLTYLEKQTSCRGIRFAVKKTGCSGLSYVMDYVMLPQAHDLIIPLTEDYSIYIEKASYPYLKGLHLDYVKQGLNYKFEFHNPNQVAQCGCGESFTVDLTESEQ